MLKKEIISHIKQHGPISVHDFMGMVVKAYYEKPEAFGKEGDFITAPEVSQLFGEVIGAWVADCWARLGMPEKWHLIEVGPGRGTLMADMLRMISKLSPCIQSMRLHLIEQSQTLSKKQTKALEIYGDVKPQWHACFNDIALDAPFILIGNEFLDALPIQQYLVKDKKVYKRYVDYDTTNDALIYTDQEEVNFTIPLALEEDVVFEHSQTRINFVKDIIMRMRETKGISLFIDYGHAKTGYGDTLQAIKNHAFTDVLGDYVGEADLTSHVDFGTLKNAVHETIHVEEITTQGAFLKQLGLVLRAQKIGAPMQDVARLVDHDQMGQLFKIFCFADKDYKLQGFV